MINCHFWTSWLLEKTKSLRATFIANLPLAVYIPIFIALPQSYKTFLCSTLLFRTYTVCSDWSKIHIEIIKLWNILIKNNFPSKFIDRCIKIFFDNLFSAKMKTVPTVPKKVVNISLPFLGKLSLKIRGNLIKLAKTYFPCCKIQVVFKSDKRLGSFF